LFLIYVGVLDPASVLEDVKLERVTERAQRWVVGSALLGKLDFSLVVLLDQREDQKNLDVDTVGIVILAIGMLNFLSVYF
jgi:hypothetical protein